MHGAMDCGINIKHFKAVWRCQQLLSVFLANGHFARVSHQSSLSANDKDDEMISGAVHRSPGIYLKTEEIPGKSQLEDSR